MKVRLTTEQELEGAAVGYRRQVNAVERGLRPRHQGPYSLWGGHIEGACAELAGSLGTGLPWTGRDQLEPPFTLPDLGEATEVRWMQSGRWLLFDERRDPEMRWYYLLAGLAPEFELVGFIHGQHCRRPEWRHEYPERVVYRVPADQLRPCKW